MMMENDTAHSLDNIRVKSGSPIVAELLEIQNHINEQEKLPDWIEGLECLSLAKPPRKRSYGQRHDGHVQRKVLERSRRFDASCERDFVAISYTHDAPRGEDDSKGGYHVLTDGGTHVPSKVRDVVLDRAIRYVKYVERVPCKGFWIDQECIDQADEREKETAIQSMDLIYKYSKYPVALLSVRIENEDDLNILARLMKGELARDENGTPVTVQRNATGEVLGLLKHITSDRWWNRAWTYQEEYCASIKMMLLISHPRSLERQKDKKVFGDLVGELCINAVKFRKEITRVCRAYQSDPNVKYDCETILRRAGRYKEILRKAADEDDGTSSSMSPLLLGDIGTRGITRPSDILAIAANCCNYTIRLDTARLDNENCSLSVSILALFLLNGEILLNAGFDNTGCAETEFRGNIFEFLSKMSMNTYRPPVDQKLTYIKACRFNNVRMLDEGVTTTGYLWKLGPKRIYVKSPSNSSSDESSDWQWLKKLTRELKIGIHGEAYKPLAKHLRRYLKNCTEPSRNEPTFSDWFENLMAAELVEAMKLGKPLRLACLVPESRKGSHSPYTAIFVEDDPKGRKHPEYIFTSVSGDDSLRNPDKHVSLLVTSPGEMEEESPNLYVDRWVNGLFFFYGRSPRNVMFPWPAYLKL